MMNMDAVLFVKRRPSGCQNNHGSPSVAAGAAWVAGWLAAKRRALGGLEGHKRSAMMIMITLLFAKANRRQ